MKKEVKNIENKEMKRYLGALSEMHNETLKGIKEGFVIVNRKLDEHSKILDSHSKVLNSHSEMMGSLAEGIEIVKEDVSATRSDLKKKVDYDDFLSLVRRVQKIEAKI